MKNRENSNSGYIAILGVLIALIISGMVIVYFEVTNARSKNIDSFAKHQEAIFSSKSGVSSFFYHVKVMNTDNVPLSKGESASYRNSLEGSQYMVTVTRRSATADHLVAPFVKEDMLGVYDVVSTGYTGESFETFIAVVDVKVALVYNFDFDKAIITEGSIDIQGSPEVLGGAIADVHTNGNGFLQNGIVIEGEFDTVGTLEIQGEVFISGTAISGADADAYELEHANAEEIPLPKVMASDYEDLADYKLVSTGTYKGKVYVKATGTYVAANTMGWKFTTGGGWSMSTSGSEPPEGFYFADADVHISKNVGSAADPFNISLATTQNFTMNGSATIAPYAADLAVIADLDIAVNGTSSANYSGIYIANEQIDFSGNSNTVGMLISTGTVSTSNTAGLTNSLSGTTSFVAGVDMEMPNTTGVPEIYPNLAAMRKGSYEEQEDNIDVFVAP